MTYANFAAEVAAYLNRSTASLTVNGVDLVLSAANKAKAEAQRRRNFKMARTNAFVVASMDGTLLSTARTTPVSTGGVLVGVKVVEFVWLYATIGASYRRARRVPMITPGDLALYYPQGTERDWQSPPPTVPYWDVAEMRAYIRGQTIYLTGAAPSGTAYLYLDVIQYLPDYTGSNTDFFLDYHSDWLLAKTLDYLNIYIKDDQRVMISQSRLEAAWTSVCSFDDSYAEDSADIGNND